MQQGQLEDRARMLGGRKRSAFQELVVTPYLQQQNGNSSSIGGKSSWEKWKCKTVIATKKSDKPKFYLYTLKNILPAWCKTHTYNWVVNNKSNAKSCHCLCWFPKIVFSRDTNFCSDLYKENTSELSTLTINKYQFLAELGSSWNPLFLIQCWGWACRFFPFPKSQNFVKVKASRCVSHLFNCTFMFPSKMFHRALH